MADPSMRQAFSSYGLIRSGGKEDQESYRKPPDGTYDGQYAVSGSSVRHGEGTLLGLKGDKYVGQWSQDKAHGSGVLQLPSGSRYEGEFKQDAASGHGTFNHPDGSNYEGQWRNDLPEGEGRETFPDGSSYSGQFCGGMKYGLGVYNIADGSKFEGQFKENEIHGHGSLSFSDGRIYEGQWRHNLMSGVGEMSWPDESLYVGGYFANQKHGNGRFEWPDGKFYEGEWRHGRQHGIGIFGVPWMNGAGGRGAASPTPGEERLGVWRNGVRACWLDPQGQDSNGVRLEQKPVRVTLVKKAEGEKFGFVHSTSKNGAPGVLLVSRIVEGGLLDRWNQAHVSERSLQVDYNARILSVNGVRQGMEAQLQSKEVVMEVLNPVHKRVSLL